MRVKCVNSKTNITTNGCFRGLKEGNEYEVVDETKKNVIIIDDEGDEVEYPKYRFRLIKEDKMENRVVRNLEDLDGLTNDYGAKIYLTTNGELRVSVGGIKWLDPKVGGLETHEVLKKLGFKFEYKPLRTINEVISEMKEVGKVTQQVCGDITWEVFKNNKNKYTFTSSQYPSIGTLQFDKETAQKYADELNEIVGG